ncbi:hypothetical protein [Leuconostoc citreum]|nr:hypothetical protein [Leuconostoc citreum]
MEYASIIGIAFTVAAAFILGVVVGDGLRDKNDKTRTQSAK